MYGTCRYTYTGADPGFYPRVGGQVAKCATETPADGGRYGGGFRGLPQENLEYEVP